MFLNSVHELYAKLSMLHFFYVAAAKINPFLYICSFSSMREGIYFGMLYVVECNATENPQKFLKNRPE